MAENPPNLATAEPFKVIERPDNPRSDPLKLELTVYPSSSTGGDTVDLPHNRWAVDLSFKHVNPQWEERFRVITGEYRAVSQGIDTTLTAGDEIVLPADVPHRHWNPSDRPTRFRYEARPGIGGVEVFETLYTLAQAGRVGADGLPTPLQFAVIQDAYPGLFYSTDHPRSVQRAMATVLAPIGRRFGYKATYSRDEIAELQQDDH